MVLQSTVLSDRVQELEAEIKSSNELKEKALENEQAARADLENQVKLAQEVRT